MRDVNLETLSWYKILPLNGFNLIRVKGSLHMRRKKKLVKIYRTVASTKSCVKRQLDGIWGKHVRFCHGNTALQHLIDPRRLASLKEPSDAQRKGRQQYCYSRDWMKSAGQILWNSFLICKMSKTSCKRGKHRNERLFGEPLTWSNNTFWSNG